MLSESAAGWLSVPTEGFVCAFASKFCALHCARHFPITWESGRRGRDLGTNSSMRSFERFRRNICKKGKSFDRFLAMQFRLKQNDLVETSAEQQLISGWWFTRLLTEFKPQRNAPPNTLQVSSRNNTKRLHDINVTGPACLIT